MNVTETPHAEDFLFELDKLVEAYIARGLNATAAADLLELHAKELVNDVWLDDSPEFIVEPLILKGGILR